MIQCLITVYYTRLALDALDSPRCMLTHKAGVCKAKRVY